MSVSEGMVSDMYDNEGSWLSYSFSEFAELCKSSSKCDGMGWYSYSDGTYHDERPLPLWLDALPSYWDHEGQPHPSRVEKVDP